MNEIIHLLNEYGYIILFLSLMLELIIVPIPNEALMSYVGVLCFHGEMNIVISIIAAGLGGVAGVTISYWLGYKLGTPFFRKFGHYIHMGPEKMEKMSKWYEKYGKVLLLVSFFIPGIRHFASIISGIIKLPYRSFAIFSYIGVFLWIGTFIWLGQAMGPKWDIYQTEIKKWLVLGSILLGFIVLAFFVVKANKKIIKESLLLIFESSFKRFKSFMKIKLIILICLTFFVTFFILMVGLIQDTISNEFDKFNFIFMTIVFNLFNQNWHGSLNFIYSLSNWKDLVTISFATILVIVINNKNKWLELVFFIASLAGILILSKGIPWMFNFMLGDHVSKNFPNEKSMLILTVLGYFLIMVIRHNKAYLLNIVMFFSFIFVVLLFSVSSVYLHQNLPSDIAAGYVFSLVWLSGLIFSLELFRFVSLLKKNMREEKF
ncbi:VTT domain-containing protein [Bacillus sp. AL-1R]